MDWITALTLGLIGSFHCAGMCGPIAIALPLPQQNMVSRVSGALLYSTGRTITYGFLGALFGLLGSSIRLAGFQQFVSILMGALMILSVVFPVLFKKGRKIDLLLSRFTGKFVVLFRKFFQTRSLYSLLIIGLLNGLLPCGLVYIAIAGAINTTHLWQGTLFMIIFGLGTAPMLTLITMAGNLVSGTLRRKINKLIPVVVVLIGILFILRGLALGIPYVSPKTKMLQPHRKMHSMEMTKMTKITKMSIMPEMIFYKLEQR